jgi:hypothetical protein
MAVELRNAAHKRLDAGELRTKRNGRAFRAAGLLLISVFAAAPAAAHSRVTPSAASEHFSELLGCPISAKMQSAMLKISA